jgi:hypothetical protein
MLLFTVWFSTTHSIPFAELIRLTDIPKRSTTSGRTLNQSSDRVTPDLRQKLRPDVFRHIFRASKNVCHEDGFLENDFGGWKTCPSGDYRSCDDQQEFSCLEGFASCTVLAEHLHFAELLIGLRSAQVI